MSIPTTKAEYKKELIRRSAEGLFPASEGGSCKYLCEDGRQCAAGVLIPKENYCPSFEGQTVCLRNDPRLLEALRIPEGVDMQQVRLLQIAHDACPDAWSHEWFVGEVEHILAD